VGLVPLASPSFQALEIAAACDPSLIGTADVTHPSCPIRFNRRQPPDRKVQVILPRPVLRECNRGFPGARVLALSKDFHMKKWEGPFPAPPLHDPIVVEPHDGSSGKCPARHGCGLSTRMGCRTLLWYGEEPGVNRHTVVKAELEQRFETLVRTHSRPVLAYCLRRSTHDDAHEAAADVFAVAWTKFDHMPEGQEALYWLFGIARRVLSNQQRSRRRRVSLNERVGSIAEVAMAGPEAVVVRNAADQEVIDAVSNLDTSDQEVLALLVWDEVPREEAARLLDISLQALHKRYQRALRRLERELRSERSRTTPPIAEEGGVL